MDMKKERMMILDMIAEGKITAAEGEQLFKEPQCAAQSEKVPGDAGHPAFRPKASAAQRSRRSASPRARIKWILPLRTKPCGRGWVAQYAVRAKAASNRNVLVR